jgi:membrane fusion protein, multidrug efflux system
MSKRAILIPFVILVVAGVILFAIAGNWNAWQGSRAEQRTDDAYVRADLTPLSTRVSGTVHKLLVGDYEPVQAGQLLVQLDDDDYAANLAQAKAALAGAEADLANNQAAKAVQDAKILNTATGIAQATAAVAGAKAAIASVEPDVQHAELERKRQEALLAAKATTHQELEGAEATAGRYENILAAHQADLQRAEAALESSRATLEAAKLERSALDVKDASYRAEIQAKQAAIIVAQVNLGYTRILAPAPGAVGERHIQEGQLVSAGMQVLDLVRGDEWIQANYKETQLTNIRNGDPADVTIDAFPGVTLHGKVLEISPASGSQFALLPPDNATGNFTKVVQRIPVKIVLDPGHPLQGRLRPGLSAIVTIRPSGKTREGAAS